MQSILEFINRYSYRTRHERKIQKLDEKVNKYMNMSDTEFLLEYVETLSLYNHKKLMFTVVFITIMLSIIMDTWKWFYRLFIKFIITQEGVPSEAVEVVKYLTIIIMISIILGSVLIICDISRRLFRLNQEKILLEQVKVMRMCKGE